MRRRRSSSLRLCKHSDSHAARCRNRAPSLIAEPGGNVAGAQLPTTGIASTNVTLAGYSSESDNALGDVINQVLAVGTYPGRASFEVGTGTGVPPSLPDTCFR